MPESFYKPLDDFNVSKDTAAILAAQGLSGSGIATGAPNDPVIRALTGNGTYTEGLEEYLRVRTREGVPVYFDTKDTPLPQTFSDFARDWENWLTWFVKRQPDLAAQGRNPPGYTNEPPGPGNPGSLADAAITAMRDQLREVGMLGGTTLNDYNGVLNTADNAVLDKVVDKAFAAFVRRLDQDSGTLYNAQTLFSEFGNFLSVTAVVFEATATTLQGTDPDKVQSAEEIVEAFWGVSGTANTTPILADIFERALAAGKIHTLPSHILDEIMTEARAVLKSNQRLSLSADEVDRRALIMEIFRILRVILERLQDTVQVQALRLQYLTQLQSNYTELINRVPIYREKPPELIGNIHRNMADGTRNELIWMGKHTNDRLNPSQNLDNRFITVTSTRTRIDGTTFTESRPQDLRQEITNEDIARIQSDQDGVVGWLKDIGRENLVEGNNHNYYRRVVGSDLKDFDLEGNRALGKTLSYGQDGWHGDLQLHWNTRQEIMDPLNGSGKEINNWDDSWLDKRGFAGITLREILTDPEVRNTILVEGPRSDGQDNVQHPYHWMDEIVYPGVWWFIEQPWDGGVKWMNGKNAQNKDDVEDAQQMSADRRNNEINPLRNQWIEQLRGFRGLVKDEAKQAQTSLTSTREAINQQANLMTAIIQQLSAILQAIFR